MSGEDLISLELQSRSDESNLLCPNCGEHARFDEQWGPGDEVWLRCQKCGKPTDEIELALAQEPEPEVIN